MNFFNYESYIFDCDGVLLNSNFIKSEAFFETMQEHGQTHAEDFLKYHEANPGLSRYVKFEHYLKNVLGLVDWEMQMQRALQKFSTIMNRLKLGCQTTEGIEQVLDELREANKQIFVSSGGDQEEVRMLLKMKNVSGLFDGIFGSPNTKFQHIDEIKKEYQLGSTVFIGDGKSDFETASHYKMSFVWINNYSYLKDQYSFLENYSEPLKIVGTPKDLL